MQQQRQGFVVWVGDIGFPVVFEIVEMVFGVGAVVGSFLSTPKAVKANEQDAIELGLSVVSHTEDGITVISMLPSNWSRELTIQAVDVFADMMIDQWEAEHKMGGWNAN